MKTIHLILLLTLLSGQLLFAQDNEIKEKICSGKWNIEYIAFDDDEKVILPLSEQLKNWIIFHPDGKHEVMEQGEKYFGEWELINEGKILRTKDRDGLVDQEIVKLTDSTLVIFVKEQYADVEMGLKKIKE